MCTSAFQYFLPFLFLLRNFLRCYAHSLDVIMPYRLPATRVHAYNTLALTDPHTCPSTPMHTPSPHTLTHSHSLSRSFTLTLTLALSLTHSRSRSHTRALHRHTSKWPCTGFRCPIAPSLWVRQLRLYFGPFLMYFSAVTTAHAQCDVRSV